MKNGTQRSSEKTRLEEDSAPRICHESLYKASHLFPKGQAFHTHAQSGNLEGFLQDIREACAGKYLLYQHCRTFLSGPIAMLRLDRHLKYQVFQQLQSILPLHPASFATHSIPFPLTPPRQTSLPNNTPPPPAPSPAQQPSPSHQTPTCLSDLPSLLPEQCHSAHCNSWAGRPAPGSS